MSAPEAVAENRVHGLLWWCIVLLSLSLLVTWLGLGWIAGDRWPIQWVVINGPGERVSDDQVRGRLLDQLNGGFFALDMSSLTTSVTELSWVASAELRRQWPDTLHVIIEEHHPVAYWGEQQLLSDRGQLFADKGNTRIQGLPNLNGPDEHRQLVISNWLAWRQQAALQGLRLTTLTLSARGSWQVVFDQKLQVELGREHEQQRLQKMLKVWPQLVQGSPPVVIDMRYSNGLVLVREPVDVIEPLAAQQSQPFTEVNNGT